MAHESFTTTTTVAATPADLAAVRRLVAEAYTVYVPRIGREPAPMTADYAALIDRGRVWVTRTADREGLLGVLVLIPFADHLLLDTVAVAPLAQGRGIGAALLAFAEAHARSLGLPEIRLYTNAAMHENLAYYPRRGYTQTHRGTVDGFHRVYFAKRLP
ncbi:GNAT family N-acetyltransferase [Dactylosporangium sp. NPDC048998]|uniref:GNAT family N-acetyltransferase n=1 Tax=Dactylosporangium sp. NPDC048998 TaxID=3363976 RepID=UPI0037186751